jgi:limonene-1,2-epoxide hydrolase
MSQGTNEGWRAPSAEERALFRKRFEHFGSAPSPETYLALFHPEARLYDDGMERPIAVSEIPAHIAGVLSLVRGFRMRPERWRERGRFVFLEAHNEGEIAGAPVSWRAVYRIELDGDLVRDGRRYFDRAPLLARIAPATLALPAFAPPPAAGEPTTSRSEGATGAAPEEIVTRCAEAWRAGAPEAIATLFREDGSWTAPGLRRPLGGEEIAAWLRHFAATLGGARLAPRAWAGDDTLLFVEWEGSVETPRGPHGFGLVDRFDLRGGRVLAGRTFFDANALARALAPAA